MVGDILPNISKELLLRFGLTFRSDLRKAEGFHEIHLTPDTLDFAEGFDIVVRVGWKKLTFSFIPGPKAGLLLRTMGVSGLDNRIVFSSVAENIISKRGNVELFINRSRYDPVDYQNLPSEWTALSITASSPFIETEGDLSEEDQLDELVVEWAGLFISMIFPLLPIVYEETAASEIQKGEFEGRKIVTPSTRHERSRNNRLACLAANGYRCKVCGINFEEKYGAIGAGFMEVHHKNPVSTMEQEQYVNPVKDLVPLCPNCHAMVHRKDPPFTVDELKLLIKK